MKQEYVNYFQSKYQMYGLTTFTEKFNLKFGTNWSKRKIHRTAANLGVTELHSPSGFFSANEAAYMLNVTRDYVYDMIRRKQISAVKNGPRYFIPMEEVDRVNDELNKPVEFEGWDTRKVSEVLGVSLRGVHNAIENGYLKAVKIKGRWIVDKEQVKWGARYAAKHGVINIPWRSYSKEVIEGAPWPYISTKEAAEILGLARTDSVAAVARRGAVESFVYKRRLYVREETVLKLKELRKTNKDAGWKDVDLSR